jgi:hypothetical protein
MPFILPYAKLIQIQDCGQESQKGRGKSRLLCKLIMAYYYVLVLADAFCMPIFMPRCSTRSSPVQDGNKMGA